MADPTHGLVGRLQRACTPVAQGVYDTGMLLSAVEEAAEAIPALSDAVARLRAERDEARLQGAREERDAVVAWLRTDEPYRTWGESIGGTELSCAIDAIERGEHIPKRPRPTEPPVVVVRREVGDE